MTKDPGAPGDIVKTTNDEIFSDKYVKFLTLYYVHHILKISLLVWTGRGLSNNMFQYNEEEKLNLVVGNLSSSFHPDIVIEALISEGKTKIVCAHQSISQVGKYENDKLYTKTCLYRNKFALITYPSLYDLNGIKLGLLYKMLVFLNNKYYLFETNEPGVFGQLMIWSSAMRSFAETNINGIISELAETGIIDIHSRYYSIWKLKVEFESITKDYNLSKQKTATQALRNWIINDCFRLYKEACALDHMYEDWSSFNEAQSVNVEDMKVAWIIFAIATTSAIFVFCKEIIVNIIMQICLRIPKLIKKDYFIRI